MGLISRGVPTNEVVRYQQHRSLASLPSLVLWYVAHVASSQVGQVRRTTTGRSWSYVSVSDSGHVAPLVTMETWSDVGGRG